MTKKCVHDNFRVEANVFHLRENDKSPITGHAADIKIECADCGEKFGFMGLPYGMKRTGATVSADKLELRAAIIPESDLKVKKESVGKKVN